MSELDEGLVGDVPPTTPDLLTDSGPPLAAAAAVALGGIDLGALLDTLVSREVSKQVSKVVSAAVAELLTPQRQQALAEAATAAVEAQWDALTAPVDAAAHDNAADGAQPPPQNHFPTVYAFVGDFLTRVYARPVRSQAPAKWCSQWYNHAEAVARLEACWKAFEVLRLDPGVGASTWWRDHADPCMAALSDPDGPFKACSDRTHRVPDNLPVQEPPAWLLQVQESTTSAGQSAAVDDLIDGVRRWRVSAETAIPSPSP